jgi:hypothetical protein
MESGTIVDYHHHKFQYVDQHKHAIVVAGFELECTLNHFVRETKVPPESQGDGKYSSTLQQTICDCHCKKGIRGIKWAKGISHSMPESGLSLLRMNLI